MTYGLQATNPFGGAVATETAREPKVNRASQSVTSGAQQADTTWSATARKRR